MPINQVNTALISLSSKTVNQSWIAVRIIALVVKFPGRNPLDRESCPLFGVAKCPLFRVCLSIEVNGKTVGTFGIVRFIGFVLGAG